MNPGYGVPQPQRYPPVPPPIPGSYSGQGAKTVPVLYGYGMNPAVPYGVQPAPAPVGTYPGLMNAAYLPRPISVPPPVSQIPKAVPRDTLDLVSDEYLRCKIMADRYSTFGADVIRSLSMVLHTTLTVNYRACVLFHRYHEAGEMGQRMAQFDESPDSSPYSGVPRGSSGPAVATTNQNEPPTSAPSLKESFERLYGFRKVPPLDPEATYNILSRNIKEAVAALLIAAKMEDDKCRVRPLLTVAIKMDINCRARLFGGATISQSAFHMSVDDKDYAAFRDAVMKEEAKILDRLSLQVHVDGPHRYVILLLRLLCGPPLTCGDVKEPEGTAAPSPALTMAVSSEPEGAHPTDATSKVGREGEEEQGATPKPKVDAFHAWRSHEILWLNRALGYVNDCARSREITKRFSAAVIACAAIHRGQPASKPLNFKHSKDSDDEKGAGPGFVWCEAFGADKREVMNCRRFFDELYTDPATWTDWRSVLWASQRRDRRHSQERHDGDLGADRKRRREDGDDDGRREGKHRRRRDDSVDRRRRGPGSDRYSRENNGGGRNDDYRRERDHNRRARSGRGNHGGRGDNGNRQRGRGQGQSQPSNRR